MGITPDRPPRLEPWFSPVARILENLRDAGRLSPPLDPIMQEIADAVRAGKRGVESEREHHAYARGWEDASKGYAAILAHVTLLTDALQYIAQDELVDANEGAFAVYAVRRMRACARKALETVFGGVK